MPFYEIKDSPSAGQGVFATRDIQIGECLIEEEPLVVVQSTNRFLGAGWFLCLVPACIWVFVPDVSALEAVHLGFAGVACVLVILPLVRQRFSLWSDVYKLDEKRKEQFFSLYGGSQSFLPWVTYGNIMRFNVYPIHGSGLVQSVEPELRLSSAVFATVCKINHSCSPNAWADWDTKKQKEVVHAVKPIKRGEEIFTSYIDVLAPRDSRQSALLRRFKFACCCSACSTPDTESSDCNRLECQDLDDQIFSLDTDAAQNEDLQLNLNNVELLMSKIDIEFGADTHVLRCRICWKAYQLANSLGNLKLAMTYAKRAYKHGAVQKGSMHPDVQAIGSAVSSYKATSKP